MDADNRAQALGAEGDVLLHTIDHDLGTVQVWLAKTLGSVLSVRDVIAVVGCLSAQIT